MQIKKKENFSFHKLGWLRIDTEEKFFVHYGNFMMDKVHHAFAENCQEQKYQTILDASYYINHDSNVRIWSIVLVLVTL